MSHRAFRQKVIQKQSVLKWSRISLLTFSQRGLREKFKPSQFLTIETNAHQLHQVCKQTSMFVTNVVTFHISKADYSVNITPSNSPTPLPKIKLTMEINNVWL